MTVQSPVDPLSVDPRLHPLAAALAPHVAVLEPGEALIIPRCACSCCWLAAAPRMKEKTSPLC